MQTYFAAFVSQGYFASAFPNVSYDPNLMAIDHIVRVVFETPSYVKHHELLWFCIDVAVILALADEVYELNMTAVSSCDLC